jgi:hypothetical protein
MTAKRAPRTLENLDALIADVTADINALFPAKKPGSLGTVLDLVDQGYSLADATKAATIGARARPHHHDHDEFVRLRKLRDKLSRERRKLMDAPLPPGDWE